MRTIVLLVFVMTTLPAAAQQDEGWEQIGQTEWPYRPSVGEIVRTSGSHLLACPFGDGLYLSVDEGEAWTPVDIGDNLPECALVEREDGALFAGMESGVYRSDDGGSTWTLAGLERWIYDLEHGPDGSLWAIAHGGDFDRVLFRSDDAMTWELVADEASIGADFVGPFQRISVSPDGLVFLGTRFGLFRSDDDGASWDETDIDPSLPGTVPSSGVVFSAGVAHIGAKASTLIERYGRGPYRSTDGGVTWSAATAPDLYIETLAVAADGSLLAGADDGVYRSADGLVWEPAGLNEPPSQVVAVLPGGDDDPAFAGTGRGIYRREGTTEWERADEGFRRGLAVQAVAVEGETLVASASGELYRYDSAADQWQWPANEGLAGDNGAYLLVPHDGALLLGTRSGLFRSEDVGETWDAIWLSGEEEGLSTFNILPSGFFVIGIVIYDCCVQTGRLLFSDDEGATWTESGGWSESPGGIPFTIAETLSNTLLVGGIVGKFYPGDVYRSDDGGATWEGRLGEEVHDLAVTPAGMIVGANAYAHYRSVDDGLTWEQTDDVGGFSLTAAPNGGLAAIRDPSFHNIRDVYYSVDEGGSWTQVSSELSASALTTDAESFIYAGTGGQGVFRSVAPLAVSSENGVEATSTFALAPAYPNPFIARARIPFMLSEPGPVTLTVHDVLGRRVATLVDATLPTGEHTAMWEASNVAGGVYVVVLRAGRQVTTQRITVAR